jgi:beta-glucanase (GH16 family)
MNISRCITFFVFALGGTISVLCAATPALVWSDEFNQDVGSAPDSSKWTHELGAGGWGNNELETYVDSRSNSFVMADPDATDGHALAIVALKSTSGAYTSARIKTQGKFSTGYGRLEARLKTSNGKGLWPAFWLLGENVATVGWPECGEIDVMETVGSNPTTVYGTLHGPGYSGTGGLSGSRILPDNALLSAAYHIYAVDWSPDKIVWSVDGFVYHTETSSSIPADSRWVFNDSRFFVLLNLAVGGGWPGNPDGTTTFPQQYTIDYVRVYGLPPSAPSTFAGFAVNASKVALSWRVPDTTNGSAITGYRLERATDSAFTENLTTFNLGTATSFVDDTAQPGATYYYRLSAVTAGGVSDASAVIKITTAATTVVEGTAKLVNISTRAHCASGNNVTIGGFVISGNIPKQVLIRAMGPSLASVGMNASELLMDPEISVHRGSATIATNDNWDSNDNAAVILETQSAVGATPPLTPGSKDSALLLTLPPGVYTFVVEARGAGSGIVLAEVYLVGA